MLVRVERYYGDELSEVHLVDVDLSILQELMSFVETSQCNIELHTALRSMAPRVAPVVNPANIFDTHELRECFCSAYLIETGRPVNVSARFQQQLK